MSKIFPLVLTIGVLLYGRAVAQDSRAASVAPAPMIVSVCDLTANPAQFADKVVRISGPMVFNHIYTAVSSSDGCRNKINYDETDDVKKDAVYKQLNDAMSAQFVPVKANPNYCMYGSCPQYRVFADLVGRVKFPDSNQGVAGPRFYTMQVMQVWTFENPFDPLKLKRP